MYAYKYVYVCKYIYGLKVNNLTYSLLPVESNPSWFLDMFYLLLLLMSELPRWPIELNLLRPWQHTARSSANKFLDILVYC